MIVCVKSVCLFVLYLGIALKTVGTGSKYNPLCVILAAYHLIMFLPQVYQVHIYNLMERKIPQWTYIYRFSFHYLLYYKQITRAFPSVLCILLIAILKDIVFLIGHAERRIATLDRILYEDKYDKRVVHLHNNVIVEDSNNRFHQHCFDTNRLYLENTTASTQQQTLALNNYRTIRKKQKQPKKFQDDDEAYYRAASNKYIFISQRGTFFILPVLLIVWCACMTDISGSREAYVLHTLISVDLFTMYFGNKVNDIAIDTSYAIAMVYLIAQE